MWAAGRTGDRKAGSAPFTAIAECYGKDGSLGDFLSPYTKTTAGICGWEPTGSLAVETRSPILLSGRQTLA